MAYFGGIALLGLIYRQKWTIFEITQQNNCQQVDGNFFFAANFGLQPEVPVRLLHPNILPSLYVLLTYKN